MGLLFVVSGPSGVGKSTVLQRVVDAVPGLSFVVSHTTRPPREGEESGLHYHFVSDAEFARMVGNGEFVEWAWVHGYRYGTSEAALAGKDGDRLIEVDVQGAESLRERIPEDAVSIFIAPPEFAVLEKRIRSRGRDSEAAVAKRLETARREMPRASEYDHRVVNDDLDQAVERLSALIRDARRAAEAG